MSKLDTFPLVTISSIKCLAVFGSNPNGVGALTPGAQPSAKRYIWITY
nr:hypothetical protein [Numidum massiliense]